ncbi:MAG: beta-ketoacyl synthase N-terminal-like domain-containing protein, partial [bacterium]
MPEAAWWNMGGFYEGISPSLWSEFIPSACTTHVAIHFNLLGPTATHSSGCVSGLDTLNWGVSQIREGKADVMIIGGADCMFTPFMWALMNRSGILSPTPDDGGSVPRPFSADHNGIALVEGGTAIILESEHHARLRKVKIYGEVLGVASVEEARTMTDLDDTGKAFAMTIKKTLMDAGIPAREIDWVCAHGTGHVVGDVAESRGIETALGDHAFCVPVSSIRGAVGQSFASGGGFQVASACLAIKHQMIPPTLNFSTPAASCNLDYVPNVARMSRVSNVLLNVAGVGGTHAGAIIGKYQR